MSARVYDIPTGPLGHVGRALPMRRARMARLAWRWFYAVLLVGGLLALVVSP